MSLYLRKVCNHRIIDQLTRLVLQFINVLFTSPHPENEDPLRQKEPRLQNVISKSLFPVMVFTL